MRPSLALVWILLAFATGGCALLAPVIPIVGANAIMAAQIDSAIGDRSVPRSDYPTDQFPGLHYKFGIPVGTSLDLWVIPYNSLAARNSFPPRPFVMGFAVSNHHENPITNSRKLKLFPMTSPLKTASGHPLFPFGFRVVPRDERRMRCEAGAVRKLSDVELMTDDSFELELKGRSACVELYYEIDAIEPDEHFMWRTPSGFEGDVPLTVHEVNFSKHYGR